MICHSVPWSCAGRGTLLLCLAGAGRARHPGGAERDVHPGPRPYLITATGTRVLVLWIGQIIADDAGALSVVI